MKVPLVLLGGIVVLSVAVARALSCVCSPLECDILTDDDCPGGLTWDPCRCCKVCARVEGEPCGGLFGFSGSCAVGLQCVIKNLLHHTKEVDEGTCTKIPARWRRHCPQGLKMSPAGCNLVGEGMTNNPENVASAGKCVCGPAVLWCSSEPLPYTFETRHACELNLGAKIQYDQLFNSPDPPAIGDGVHGTRCPEDSFRTEDGTCKCVSVCPPTNKCREGERPEELRATEVTGTPGRCCPLYDCVPSEPVSWVRTDDYQTPDGCIDSSGVPRASGEQWNQGACVNCTCDEGTASCHATMCKSCENPAPIAADECCPRCLDTRNETSTMPCSPIMDCEPPCKVVINEQTQCPTCQCPANNDCPSENHCGPTCVLIKTEGVCSTCVCESESNLSSLPSNPETSDDSGIVCPSDNNCGPTCVLIKNEGACSTCICESESRLSPPPRVPETPVHSGVVCPELKCDLHCERGLIMDENDCTLCQCKPHAGCPLMTACKRKCPYGYKTNRRGCPVCRCRATCTDLHNTTHPEGTSWEPDACTTCNCDTVGRLVCKETVCSVACINPMPPPPGSCCPICPNKHPDRNEPIHHMPRGWGTVPIILISMLALICIMLVFYVIRGRFRGHLSQKATHYSTYPTQYYKCVPAYDTPVHRNEKIVPL